jgi:hypothetical protein
MVVTRICATVGLRLAETAISRARNEWLLRLTRPGADRTELCPVCTATLSACKCDAVRVWLILRASDIGRRPKH